MNDFLHATEHSYLLMKIEISKILQRILYQWSVSCIICTCKKHKEEAEAFATLCRIAVRVGEEASPIIIEERFAEYKELVGIDFDKIVSLTSLGLIETDLGKSAGYMQFTLKVN